ncbi:septum formation inhibitor Maf [Clostridium sporogenes]|uniref:dTTP/UTP pyrophosphatase n=2 Tax=Clostridium botulinum TaxID=1491 RepID=A0ABC8CYQ5_CLOBO|nr:MULTISPECIES: Maf-like protein [Clostridium]AVQ38909.1 Maf-like protein [Clostridium botulinum]EJE7233578.1 Maf-like protein [Clostridium botulinum]KYN77207.1 septum formation inhibitor Maf [Clostridium sporogenes]MBE6056877.1 Maf-like protein [Clostridium sp.]MCW6060704.1 Maf-like protein [Clostridium sporogenes]
MENIILASASQRRQELLKRILGNFQIIVSDFDESSIPFKNNIPSYVMNLAEGKARSVSKKIMDQDNNLIIGCDTIVAFNNRILGKPKDKKDAFEMLQALSGNEHEVYSGLAILDVKSNKIIKDFVCTKVKFSKLSSVQIEKYINTGDPMDKAGAYGIQGKAGVFVENINGCYYNVVGLPLNKLNSMLMEMGVNL